MGKTIFILLDGCGFTLAQESLGYAEHLVEQGLGSKYKVLSQLPSLSRPLYETLLTGRTVFEHGIATNNMTQRPLTVLEVDNRSVFQLCTEQGRTTAASAYYWISELYVKAPFDHCADRLQLDGAGSIGHGVYYFEDEYPDSHVFVDGELLRRCFDPDFLMIHTMNIDDAGHKRLQNEQRLRVSAAIMNGILGNFLPGWLALGYEVVITADHGMDEYGLHGGNSVAQRQVPLYIFSSRVKKGDFSDQTISQLSIAPLLCQLLGIEKATGMRSLENLEVDFFEA